MKRINWKQVEKEAEEIENDPALSFFEQQREIRSLYSEMRTQYNNYNEFCY